MMHVSGWGLIALAALPVVLSAQPLLEEVGGGVGLQGITGFLVDNDHDRLFMSGSFAYANDNPVSPGVLEWSSDSFSSVGCGVEWNCVTPGSLVGLANPTRALAIWHGDLYLGGDISFTRNGYDYEGVMRWDGTEWYPLGTGINGRIQSIKVIDGELIVAGWFTYADTVLANGLARWDGERWHRVVDVPQFDPGSTNYVNDVAVFQGQWYIGGNMGAIGELARFNGSSWEEVGGGFSGVFASVNELSVHDDRLYVAGSFSKCQPYGVASNPGSGLVAWDGAVWDDLDGGTCGSVNAEVFSTLWWNEELYACGRFDVIGQVPGNKLARWDGEEWCMLLPPDYIYNGGPMALAVYHDSLYIGGSFVEAGGYEVSCFGKWIGGDQTYACASTMNVEETVDGIQFSVFPNPAHDRLTWQGMPASTTMLLVLDVLGRELGRVTSAFNSMSIGHLPTGTYSVRALDRSGQVVATARFVRE